MSKIYLGIDPGEKGGLAWLDSDGNLLECVKMPSTPEDVYIQQRPRGFVYTHCLGVCEDYESIN